MDFELSAEQEAIKIAAKEFAKGEFDKSTALEHERSHSFPFDIWKKACSLGFLGIHFPEEYGGQGFGVLENTLTVEEFCRQDSSIGIAISLADFAAEIILRFGTNEQKEKYLIPIAKGNALSSGGFTEPDHGSDITFMNTTAMKNDNKFVINGVKTFITNGTVSNFALVLCQTDPEAKPTYRGQSIILVERDSPGYTTADLGEKMGIKMSSTGEISFNNVEVPVVQLVGEENKGFYHTLEFFNEARIEIAAQALGIAEGAFDRALVYTKQREQFGKRISEFQVTKHKLADMVANIETARLIVYRAAWNVDKGQVSPKLSSIAKMYSGRVATDVAYEAIQLHGGYGYMLEFEVERFYRDARITEIYMGTREIQKNTIAKALFL